VLGGGAAGADEEAVDSPDDEAGDEAVLDRSKVPVPHAVSAIANPIPAAASIRGPWMFRVVARRLSFVGDLMTPPGIGGREPRSCSSGKASGASSLCPAARRYGTHTGSPVRHTP
jgi:hypothetical protein